jgi:hypothetical protein
MEHLAIKHKKRKEYGPPSIGDTIVVGEITYVGPDVKEFVNARHNPLNMDAFRPSSQIIAIGSFQYSSNRI